METPAFSGVQPAGPLPDRKALIVGAASGIGRATAVALAQAGAAVICADISLEGAEETASMLPEPAAGAHQVDVRDDSSLDALADATGAPDILVISAGTHVRQRVVDMTSDVFSALLDVNLIGTFRTLRTFGGVMAQNGGGSVVCFSSIRAASVERGQGAYAASKAGVLQLTRAFAAEMAEFGVRANAVAPGYVRTPLTARIAAEPEWEQAIAEKTILRRWAEPAEIANVVLFLASEASSYITGACLFVDGGWTAIDGRYTAPESVAQRGGGEVL